MSQIQDYDDLVKYRAELNRNADALAGDADKCAAGILPMLTPYFRKLAAEARADVEWLDQNFDRLAQVLRHPSGLGWPG